MPRNLRNGKSLDIMDGKVVHLRHGVALYKVKASPYWKCRIWLPAKKKRIVKSTRETARAEAIRDAEELFAAMGSRGVLDSTPKEKTFEHFADKLAEIEIAKGKSGEIFQRQHQNTSSLIRNQEYGAVVYFKDKSIDQIGTREFNGYISWVRSQKPTLSVGTLNHIAVVFRKVMTVAYNAGVIASVPETPRQKQKDNPRSFFRFKPLVSKEHDEYKLLIDTADAMAKERVRVRETVITDELRDFILFMTHSFMRPTESEVYALTHRDISTADNPKRLIVTIRKGKTGHRISNTMPAAVTVYHRIKRRQEGHAADDFLFLPKYKNRSHAKRIIQRQFNALLERCGLKRDRHSPNQHTVYSLRHTAICMRLILSEGRVNIFNLAKNAGTSVDQIERFYARNLPLSAEMARNLQAFGAGS